MGALPCTSRVLDTVGSCLLHEQPSRTMASLLLPVGGTSLNVKVHPVVLMQICDAYLRRNKSQERVIGTLLGVATDNLVQISRCYVVPHNESADQVHAPSSCIDNMQQHR